MVIIAQVDVGRLQSLRAFTMSSNEAPDLILASASSAVGLVGKTICCSLRFSGVYVSGCRLHLVVVAPWRPRPPTSPGLASVAGSRAGCRSRGIRARAIVLASSKKALSASLVGAGIRQRPRRQHDVIDARVCALDAAGIDQRLGAVRPWSARGRSAGAGSLGLFGEEAALGKAGIAQSLSKRSRSNWPARPANWVGAHRRDDRRRRKSPDRANGPAGRAPRRRSSAQHFWSRPSARACARVGLVWLRLCTRKSIVCSSFLDLLGGDHLAADLGDLSRRSRGTCHRCPRSRNWRSTGR